MRRYKTKRIILFSSHRTAANHKIRVTFFTAIMYVCALFVCIDAYCTFIRLRTIEITRSNKKNQLRIKNPTKQAGQNAKRSPVHVGFLIILNCTSVIDKLKFLNPEDPTHPTHCLQWYVVFKYRLSTLFC